MTRIALYARYSSDQQREASIEDQFRICRDRARKEGWRIIDMYHDAGISGSSMILRPGIQSLLQDAQAGQFDLVLAEALDRISRDQADVAIYARRFAELADALNHPETRAESADQLRVLIDKIVLTPGPSRGEVYARLHGDLATILEWTARQEGKAGTKNKTPGGTRSGVLVSVVAGARSANCFAMSKAIIPPCPAKAA